MARSGLKPGLLAHHSLYASTVTLLFNMLIAYDPVEDAAKRRIDQLQSARQQFSLIAAVMAGAAFSVNLFEVDHLFVWITGAMFLLFAWWAYQVGTHAQQIEASLNAYLKSDSEVVHGDYRADEVIRATASNPLRLIF